MGNLDKRTLTKVVTLPSLGAFYEGKIPGGEIKIASFTTREEKIFSGAGGGHESKLTQVFQNCVEFPDKFNPKDLVLPDRLFLLIQIRGLSYGNAYSFQHKCEQCSVQARHDKNLLDDFPYTEATEEYQEPYNITLPHSGKKLGLRLLRGFDEAALAKHVAMVQQKVGVQSGDPAYTLRLAKHIETVDDEQPESRFAIQTMVDNLEGPDSLALRDAIDDMNFGYDLQIDVECPSCGFFHDEVTLPFGAEFFRPRRKRSRDVQGSS